ncbi:hypothetical protein LCGC14_2454570 [marine sediment metagenome]|uniref:Uncharacterized protein n=1 Tax=marine sediment metagenome TaxID=412755 RepID=A0A0F9BF22_9ZZZZ
MMWPRVDAAVTAQPNHLMKSPFAMHAGTGRVCYMLRADATDDPLRAAPTDEELRGNVAQFAARVRDIVDERRRREQAR